MERSVEPLYDHFRGQASGHESKLTLANLVPYGADTKRFTGP